MESRMDEEVWQTQLRAELQHEELTAEGGPSGVEKEAEEPFPFDAKKISITNKPVSLESLLRRLRQGTISAPAIQRGANIWGDEQQSRLVESLMLRIPLPMFYVAADASETWKVVDGLQRITAIRRFIQDKAFRLSGLEFLEEYNDSDFESLPQLYQNRILETELQFAIIGPSTPENVQRNIFKRLNTGGMPLTAQEIRHALYYGPAAELLQELVSLDEFKAATAGSVDDSRMAGRELILRFLAFFIFGPEGYPVNGDMDSFLCNAMKVLNEPERQTWGSPAETPPVPRMTDPALLKACFCRAMIRAEQLFGKYAFRKSLPEFSSWRSPVNKALFEVWAYYLAELSEESFQLLLLRKDMLFRHLHDDTYTEQGGRFLDAISRYSHTSVSVAYRYRAIKSCLDAIVGKA